MGRPPQVSNEKAILILIKHIEHFKNGNIPPTNHKVYQEISDDLGGAWKPHTVYTHVKENRNNHLRIALEQSKHSIVNTLS